MRKDASRLRFPFVYESIFHFNGIEVWEAVRKNWNINMNAKFLFLTKCVNAASFVFFDF